MTLFSLLNNFRKKQRKDLKIYLQGAFVNAKVYAKAQKCKLNIGDVIECRIFFLSLIANYATSPKIVSHSEKNCSYKETLQL